MASLIVSHRPFAALSALAALALLTLSGCVSLDNRQAPAASVSTFGAHHWSSDTLNIDFATYNPLSLIIKDQGWLEKAVGNGVTVNWVPSTGSNKANEGLRSGELDVGSTAGSAALLARSTGSAIKTIDVFGQPNWAAIVVPKGSSIKSVKDLKGKKIAVTKGTDPYFFLLQALEKAGVGLNEVTIDDLQHPDGKAALESGAVDAWSGLDPLLSSSVESDGSKIIYDNPEFNSYGFLNATEDFLAKSPDLAQLVVNAYEKARAWAEGHPESAVKILAKGAGIDKKVASSVLIDRTNLDIDPVPGEAQAKVLKVIGSIFIASGDVKDQEAIDDALKSLFEPSYAEKADPNAL